MSSLKTFDLAVAVLGLDVVGEGLGLLVLGGVVVVVVVVVLGSNVLHLVDAAALGATLDGALAVKLRVKSQLELSVASSLESYAEPVDNV